MRRLRIDQRNSKGVGGMTKPTRRFSRMVWDYLYPPIWVVVCWFLCIAFILLWPECIMNTCGHNAKADLAAMVFLAGEAYMIAVWLVWRILWHL